MAINDLYSKRQRRARGEMPDVFQYDFLPDELRMQVVFIIRDMFIPKSGFTSTTEEAFERIHHALCREYGAYSLSVKVDPRKKYPSNWDATLTDFATNAATVEQVLDLIEAAFQEAQRRDAYGSPYYHKTNLTPKQAADEINIRFKERGAGYQYENGEIMRVDSQYLHTEAVKPALTVLADKRFAGANAEFLKAHEHYRHGRNGEAMNECLKALESSLKVICRDRKWPYKETDTANTLLNIVFTNGLVPNWLQSEFAAVRTTLESGVPTTRNRVSGHGSGAQPRDVPDYFAAYLLHLTAAAIVFLAQAEKATRP